MGIHGAKLGGLLLTLLASAHWHMQGTAASSSFQEGRYIYCFLYFGPSNQFLEFHACLAYAKLLGRTVILPTFLNHYLAVKTDGVSLSFDDVWDRPNLEARFKVVSAPELRAQGWDGQVDATMFITPIAGYLKNTYTKATGKRTFLKTNFIQGHLNVMNMTLEHSKGNHTWPNFPTSCSTRALQKISEGTAEYRVLGMVPPLVYPDHGTACRPLIETAICALQRHQRLQHHSEVFRKTYLPGNNFVAVHIRPKPDGCLIPWRKPLRDWNTESELQQFGKCDLPSLHADLVPYVRHIMKESGASQVFVMSMPSIATHIMDMFAQAGLQPVKLNVEQSDAMLGSKSITLNMLLEQEVARHAKVFIGSGTSTATQGIQAMRECDNPKDSKTIFFNLNSRRDARRKKKLERAMSLDQ